MEVKKPKIAREILKFTHFPTRNTSSYWGRGVGKSVNKLKALIPVVPKVCSSNRVGSATSSLVIRGYVYVMATLKFVYYFNLNMFC
jgi:hypothetical protein